MKSLAKLFTSRSHVALDTNSLTPDPLSRGNSTAGSSITLINGSGLKFGQATECIHFSLTIASRSLDPRTTKHYVSRLTPEIVLLGGSGLKFGQAASYEFIKPRTA